MAKNLLREWTVTRVWRVKAPTAAKALGAAKAGGHFKGWASEIIKVKNGWTKGANTVLEKS